MSLFEFCNSGSNPDKRRQDYQHRKLEFLSLLRDSLERRLSSVNASIQTLNDQINRDKENDIN